MTEAKQRVREEFGEATEKDFWSTPKHFWKPISTDVILEERLGLLLSGGVLSWFSTGAGWCGVSLPWVTGCSTYAISSQVQQTEVINII